MKKYLFLSVGLLSLSAILFSSFVKEPKAKTVASQITWRSLEHVDRLRKDIQKPILVDVYTDWCKWCKVMDESTFQDPAIIDYVNQHFYAVKLNAEQKEAISLHGNIYEYQPMGRRGINNIVLELLGSRPSYPSLVLLDGDMRQKKILKGYQKTAQLMPQLKNYLKENMLTSN